MVQVIQGRLIHVRRNNHSLDTVRNIIIMFYPKLWKPPLISWIRGRDTHNDIYIYIMMYRRWSIDYLFSQSIFIFKKQRQKYNVQTVRKIYNMSNRRLKSIKRPGLKSAWEIFQLFPGNVGNLQQKLTRSIAVAQGSESRADSIYSAYPRGRALRRWDGGNCGALNMNMMVNVEIKINKQPKLFFFSILFNWCGNHLDQWNMCSKRATVLSCGDDSHIQSLCRRVGRFCEMRKKHKETGSCLEFYAFQILSGFSNFLSIRVLLEFTTRA